MVLFLFFHGEEKESFHILKRDEREDFLPAHSGQNEAEVGFHWTS